MIPTKSNIRFVDAFSGAGGFTLGLSAAGMTPLLSFDNDPCAIATMGSNPSHIQHKLELVDAWDLTDGRLSQMIGVERGDLEVLVGGAPCQGFSVQRIGEDSDVRNDLIMLFGQLVIETLPRMFLMENVPGLRGKRGRLILDNFMKTVSEVGYFVHSVLLDAQNFGVPQRRRRLFLVGELNPTAFTRFRFPDPQSHRKTVRDAIGYLPEPPTDFTEHPDYPGHRRDRLTSINRQRLEALQSGQGREQLPAHLLANCHRLDSRVIGHRNVYGRMSWEEVAPTITARFDSFTRGQFGHPEQTRSISLHEGALLQTFPPDYIFTGSKVEVARQIGNAVPPVLAKTIGESVILAMKQSTH